MQITYGVPLLTSFSAPLDMMHPYLKQNRSTNDENCPSSDLYLQKNGLGKCINSYFFYLVRCKEKNPFIDKPKFVFLKAHEYFNFIPLFPRFARVRSV